MTDISTGWLIEQIRQNDATNSLWFSDENSLLDLHSVSQLAHKPKVLSNRWDISQIAQNLGFETVFNDFDTQAISSNSVERIFYRVSKEKSLVHHLINHAGRLLKPGGEFLLCGEKKEGIKTYIDKAATYLGCTVKAHKDGMSYHAVLTRAPDISAAAPLDDQDYTRLRSISIEHLSFFSKPGLFGWNKIDQGSALLVTQLNGLLAGRQPQSLLDLGCGYGYLTLMTRTLKLQKRFATDNNAAALLAARENFSRQGLEVDLLAGDAGNTLTDTVDLILCNPPFHQGFQVDGDLTDKFLAASKRLLHRQGLAVFVVNQFIPLERKAAAHFTRIQTIVSAQGFKVVCLGH